MSSLVMGGGSRGRCDLSQSCPIGPRGCVSFPLGAGDTRSFLVYDMLVGLSLFD